MASYKKQDNWWKGENRVPLFGENSIKSPVELKDISYKENISIRIIINETKFKSQNTFLQRLVAEKDQNRNLVEIRFHENPTRQYYCGELAEIHWHSGQEHKDISSMETGETYTKSGANNGIEMHAVFKVPHEEMSQGYFLLAVGIVFKPAKPGSEVNRVAAKEFEKMLSATSNGKRRKVDLDLSKFFNSDNYTAVFYNGSLTAPVDDKDRNKLLVDHLVPSSESHVYLPLELIERARRIFPREENTAKTRLANGQKISAYWSEVIIDKGAGSFLERG